MRRRTLRVATLTALMLLAPLILAAPAHAESTTTVTLRCEGQNAVAQMTVTLTLDGTPIAGAVLACQGGGPLAALHTDIVTQEEPNDWHVEIIMFDPVTGEVVAECHFEGTNLPSGNRQCTGVQGGRGNFNIVPSSRPAGTTSTQVRIACEGIQSAGTVQVILTHDGRPIGGTLLRCAAPDQVQASAVIITDLQPNDWHIRVRMTDRSDPENPVDIICEFEGIFFPVMERCAPGPADAINVMIGGPRAVPGG